MSINPYTTLYRDNTGERLKPRDSHDNTIHTILYIETLHDTVLVIITVVLIVIVIMSVILTLRLLL
jgi:hypothetical protein